MKSLNRRLRKIEKKIKLRFTQDQINEAFQDLSLMLVAIDSNNCEGCNITAERAGEICQIILEKQINIGG